MTEWQCIPHGWHVHVNIDRFTVASGFISNGLRRSVCCPWPGMYWLGRLCVVCACLVFFLCVELIQVFFWAHCMQSVECVLFRTVVNVITYTV